MSKLIKINDIIEIELKQESNISPNLGVRVTPVEDFFFINRKRNWSRESQNKSKGGFSERDWQL